MATGYTHDVVTGELTDFSKFLMRCAHAFIVDLKEAPMDSPIPDEFPQRGDWRERSVEKAEAALAEVLAMTPEDKLKLTESQSRESVESARKAIQAAREKRLRIEAMLDKVLAWNPPSGNHHNLKKFMRDQLNGTREWDCDTQYYEKLIDQAQTPVDPEEVYRKEVEFRTRQVAEAREDLRKERERYEQTKLWIRQLKESVAAL